MPGIEGEGLETNYVQTQHIEILGGQDVISNGLNADEIKELMEATSSYEGFQIEAGVPINEKLVTMLEEMLWLGEVERGANMPSSLTNSYRLRNFSGFRTLLVPLPLSNGNSLNLWVEELYAHHAEWSNVTKISTGFAVRASYQLDYNKSQVGILMRYSNLFVINVPIQDSRGKYLSSAYVTKALDGHIITDEAEAEYCLQILTHIKSVLLSRYQK